jgi:hypothetical protein
MPFAIVYQDYARNAVLGGGNFVSTLPRANLQTDDPRTVARTLSADADDTFITADLGAIRQIGGIVLGPTNASPGSSYRIRSYADAGMTVAKYDSGVKELSGAVVDWSDTNEWLEWEDPDFWLGLIPSDVEELPLYIVETIPAAQVGEGNAQWWKIELFDPGNAQGHIDIGRLVLGRVFRPVNNYEPGSNEFSFQWLTDVTESIGGLRTYWERGMRRSGRFSWPVVDESEAFDDWFRLGLRSGLSRQVFIIPEESDTGELLRKRAFLATLTKSPPLVQINLDLASTSIDAEEVI